MALAPGAKIGHYDVTALLGEGGMGQVWQATDTQLGREVALKILPDAFAADPDRLARFTREAQILASLNHPNIAAIYGIEEADGTRALVLELVEGPTLADRISKGPIPLDEALPIAKQIAEALEAAHEAGVIHRDLKPANIKVREDGTVKVLDFGLAKAFQSEAGDASASMSPTISLTAAATQMGMVIGTAAYMAPEQASGKVVDKRADVWAFGVVLYEMLTGARPFVGDDVSKTLAHVIAIDPDWSALPKALPPVLGTFLRGCLEKNPKQRVHDVADVRLAMEGAFETAVTAPTTAPQLQVWQRPIPATTVALLLALTSSLAVWAIVAGRTTLPSATTTRFTFTLPDSDLLPGGGGTRVALSPDGRTLVYRATRGGVDQLFRRPIDQFGAVPMMDTEGGRDPFFSPDGQWVGFFAGGALKKVALAGGPAQELTELPGNGHRGASWGADDMIVLGRAPGLAQVPAAGGELTVIAEREGDGQLWYPQVLPGTGAILFTVSDPNPDAGELQVLVPETGERRSVLANAVAGRVLETGHLVFVRSGALWAVPFDRDRLHIVGTPTPVVEGVVVAGGGAVQYAVADNGSLAYMPGSPSAGGTRRLMWVDRNGGEETIAAPASNYFTLSLSPDGTRAAIHIQDSTGTGDVWVSELSRGTLARLTTGEAFDGSPLWSPDGSRVAFESHRNGQPEVFWRAADSSGPAELLLTVDESVRAIVPSDWSPDATILFAHADFPETGSDVGMVSIDGPGTWEPLIRTAADEWSPAISPDGRWLAYTSDETGRDEVYVQRFPELEGRTQISVGGGEKPTWSADGLELFYLRARPGPPDAGMRVTLGIDEGDPPSLIVGTPEHLFDWRYFGVGGFGSLRRYHDVSPDGQRFLVIAPETGDGERGRAEINVVLNWFEELKERVPVP